MWWNAVKITFQWRRAGGGEYELSGNMGDPSELSEMLHVLGRGTQTRNYANIHQLAHLSCAHCMYVIPNLKLKKKKLNPLNHPGVSEFCLLKRLCSGCDSESESLIPSLWSLRCWVNYSTSLSLSFPIYNMGIKMIPTYLPLSVMWGLNKVIHRKHLMSFWHIVNVQLMSAVIILMRN